MPACMPRKVWESTTSSGEGSVQGIWENRRGCTSGPFDMWVTLASGVSFEPFGPWTGVVFDRPETVTALTLALAAPVASASESDSSPAEVDASAAGALDPWGNPLPVAAGTTAAVSAGGA